MSGSFPPTVDSGISAVGSDTGGPSTTSQEPIGDPDAVVSAVGAYAIPYNQQQGLTRYAPMPPQPGTRITAQHASPLNTPSSVAVAVKYLGTPRIVTTVTQSRPVTVTSIENPVCIMSGIHDAH